MKLLAIHPEDGLLDGPWANSAWDRVVDLGRSGAETYAEAGERFCSKVEPLDNFRHELEEIRHVRELMALGMGRLRDAVGLDWWELTAIMVHPAIETAVMLERLARDLGPEDEVHVSRPGFHEQSLEQLLGRSVQAFATKGDRTKRGPGHYARLIRKFPAQQLLEIFWDKTDPGYQWRGRMTKPAKPGTAPVILLPSAYGNVTRTEAAYARALPESQFLLVATRRSGWSDDLPSNVSARWLQTYASVDRLRRRAEIADLVERWYRLRKDLEQVPVFRVLAQTGRFDDFPERFARGLEIRDAWRNVIDREPVQAVLCADDSNPNTHMPLLLAKKKGIPTVACHHGALDGRYLFKRPHADVFLAKGRMEEDYLVRVCGVAQDLVEVGGPGDSGQGPRGTHAGRSSNRTIVFISEPYESSGGRGRDFYRDTLPRLADLAVRENCELVIKLHPFESLAERKQVVRGILSPAQHRVVRWVSGPMAPDLLDSAWFAVTVLSTVAVECGFRGVPCFLCKWLECWPYGYVDQFLRFGVGMKLSAPEEIEQIPQMIANFKPSRTIEEDCGVAISRDRLETLLGVRAASHAATTAIE